MSAGEIKVAELFAGVGGFRVGLEAASPRYRFVWSNQWEPSTKAQHASLVYQARFGAEGHSNSDIASVPTDEIPDHDLLVGGFPCQDYSVAASLSKSGGIEGKKGVLWWQIYRILKEKGDKRPSCVFLENVDRLLSSPARQRGRDFAIILSSLSSLDYAAEWAVVNAADYGMPQRRRRTYLLAFREDRWTDAPLGTLDDAFPIEGQSPDGRGIAIGSDIRAVSEAFNKENRQGIFLQRGAMRSGTALTYAGVPRYGGERTVLGDILVDEGEVPEEFFISEANLPRWQFEKGAKKVPRKSKDGFEYTYAEGAMPFPDPLDRPSRTIITGEGGNAPSRFKHVVETPSGRLRRLVPIELERLNMFPDGHTRLAGVSDGRRAFLMGNALVCGVVERIGRLLAEKL